MFPHHSGIPQAALSSDPPFLNGTVCQLVQMTCKIEELDLFGWYFNDVREFAYAYLSTDVIPLTIHDANGINIEITEASAESTFTDIFNATSVLTATTSALSMLNVDKIRCGTNAIRSETIILNFQGQLKCRLAI